MTRKRGSWLALALMVGLLGGCAPRRFVVGIYDAPRAALPTLARAGFDVVTVERGETNRTAYLDAARTNGLGVIATPFLGNRKSGEAMRRWDRHPALWAWYLSDEPDLNVISPEALRARRRALRAVAGKPAYLVVASGAALEKYGSLAEILAVDWYPVPWAPVGTVAREMRSARLAADGKPFVAIIQAFDWAAFPGGIQSEKKLRAPTPEEMRCMAFLSLFQGARGVLFYSYRAGGWALEEQPEVWEAVLKLVGELKEKEALFEQRVGWWPVQTKYGGAPQEMYNEIQEGAVALNLFQVKRGRNGVRAGYYLVGINTTGRAVTFGFRRPFGEGAWVTREFTPYEVYIEGPINESLVKEKLP